MSKAKGIIGIVLLVLAIILLFSWEVWGRRALTYDSVLVLKENIKQAQVVTEDNLTVKRVAVKEPDALGKNDGKKIIGKEAKHFVHKNTELYEEYFDTKGVNPSDSTFIYSIPLSFIKSLPQSLRRGDIAYIYGVDQGRTKLITFAKVAFSKDNSNNEVTSENSDRLSSTGMIASVEVIVNQMQADMLTKAISDEKEFVIMYR